MIPKIIHYCWFGGKEIPEEYAGYIAEWKQLHPGWEIMRWDEENIAADSAYLQNAIALGNWANCSNYARLKVLQQYGGIYLDTDMKLLKPLDSFLDNTCFLSFESGSEKEPAFFVNNAVSGSVAEGAFVGKCLQELEQTFTGDEEAHLSSPHLATKVLQEFYGLEKYGDQMLNEVRLYNSTVFFPLPFARVYARNKYLEYCSPETVGVHMWARTWLSRETMLAAIDELQSWSQDLVTYIEDLKIENNWLKGNLQVEQEKVKRQEALNEKLKTRLKNLKKKVEEKESIYQRQLNELNQKIFVTDQAASKLNGSNR
ncbi:glycosyltransferase [Adhaeribacter soli]|uniref:Alpha 1,4-glycosyltransferase domain-containing protein n=1 Tax=Adhaeribacter soli TaxID=2607655 RepID=A0A5N1IXG4_9BACT|nr:glycosyltransferase [Adhaeribacter soli]KAA9339030.1 hypothetical protein F0P94_09585 [Adhaeribacter soli]